MNWPIRFHPLHSSRFCFLLSLWVFLFSSPFFLVSTCLLAVVICPVGFCLDIRPAAPIPFCVLDPYVVDPELPPGSVRVPWLFAIYTLSLLGGTGLGQRHYQAIIIHLNALEPTNPDMTTTTNQRLTNYKRPGHNAPLA